jgi:hypothetical protein
VESTTLRCRPCRRQFLSRYSCMDRSDEARGISQATRVQDCAGSSGTRTSRTHLQEHDIELTTFVFQPAILLKQHCRAAHVVQERFIWKLPLYLCATCAAWHCCFGAPWSSSTRHIHQEEGNCPGPHVTNLMSLPRLLPAPSLDGRSSCGCEVMSRPARCWSLRGAVRWPLRPQDAL